MKAISSLAAGCVILGAGLLAIAQDPAGRHLPAPLKEWQDWATWEVRDRDCPTPFNDAARRVCYWPGELSLTADRESGTWELRVAVFGRTWVPLPGGGETWPTDVRVDGAPAAVVEHHERPCLELEPGRYRVTGGFRWEAEMPQVIRVPREVGLLALVLEGKKVEIPNWDEAGGLWLKRVRLEATDKDTVAAQVWRVIEDGIPLWLRTELELSVSGKSREEDLGTVVPEGWSIATVDAPVPVALNDQGRLKAQVRAGKWTVRVDAFRTTDAGELRFAAGAQPIVATELVGFRAAPEFRLAELDGLQAVDVSQTTFPAKWRNLPVYQWPTDRPFRLVEKMRGMGRQRPEGLKISRVFWLDEDGRGLTFRDQIQGTMQQIWRLDVAEGQELGAAKIAGQAQLITVNPANRAPGIEIRTRNLDLQAIGRSDRVQAIPATGWRSAADGLHVAMNLPPGWRLLALFGADWVEGDWLTAWTLLDLFLVLVFSMAVFKLWGWKAGLVAFFAFGLGYHEPGAPRLAWLFLLLPLALLRVVPEGGVRRGIAAWRWLAFALLLAGLVPFVAAQLQSVIYPQLERQGHSYGSRPLFGWRAYRPAPEFAASFATPLPSPSAAPEAAELARPEDPGSSSWGKRVARYKLESNLLYESKARIQTGPAEPEWSWNLVRCGWNGPVSVDETIRPILISTTVHRGLTLLRVALLLALGGLLLRRYSREPAASHAGRGPGAGAGAAAALLLALGAPASSWAQVPDRDMLNTLRNRLRETSDAYPQAAEIAAVDLKLADGRISLSAEIHAVRQVAVPLPGQLPSWSPVSVTMDDRPEAVLRRDDGYLWVVVPAGVHRVRVDGLVPSATEWEWAFRLKPRRVAIDAPGWTVTGLRPNGVPENQIFFARQREAAAGEAEYDRKDFKAIVAVGRHLEIGLIWQVRTLVTRLAQTGKAVSLRVPLLAGEKVLTPGVIVQERSVEVRLGAGEAEFAWESELPIGLELGLVAEPTERWVERWHLVTSPVWNVALAGLAPVFETSERHLVPVWHPWPGERVTPAFSKPEAVSGDTLTVRRVSHVIALGSRQRASELTLEVEASLGDDFILELDPQAEVSSLKLDDRSIPVRREGARLVVPVHPGSQAVRVEWRSNELLETRAVAGTVKLPVEAANMTTVMQVPESRWVLWAAGPRRGPAVRFWSVLAVSLLAAWVLGGLKHTPLSRLQWVLLALGLTQIHLAAALTVVGWFFLVTWRGRQGSSVTGWKFDLLPVFLAVLTLAAIGILVAAVREGLLGNPEMFIRGNSSSRTELRWFQPRGGTDLPLPVVVSVSVWFYRLLMLAWALWLAAALIRWLRWTWTQFSQGGCWKPLSRRPNTPPLLPAQKA